MKKKERVEKIKNQYKAVKLERRAMKGMDSFPDDKEDEARRLRMIMEQMSEKGCLTQEEKEKVFGPGGYLEQAEQEAAKSPKVVWIKEAPVKKNIWHHAAKWASVAAIFCVSIVVLTMSSEANREYVKDTVQYYIGDDVVVKSSSDSDQVIRNVTETEMRTDIKEKLDIEVPKFQYKPEKTNFVKYEIYNNDKMALIYYTIEEKKVVLCISNSNNNRQNMKTYDGKLIDTIQIDYEEFMVDIFENLDKNSNQKSYSARWEREEIGYRLSGIIEKEEFYKILKKMSF